MDSSLEYYEVAFWVSFYGPFLKSILSDMSMAALAFFFFLSIFLDHKGLKLETNFNKKLENIQIDGDWIACY